MEKKEIMPAASTDPEQAYNTLQRYEAELAYRNEQLKSAVQNLTALLRNQLADESRLTRVEEWLHLLWRVAHTRVATIPPEKKQEG